MGKQQLLSLLHLSSPSLPIGAFAYSQGLETAIDIGWVSDQQSLHQWLQPQLQYSLKHMEIPLLKRCYLACQTKDMTALQHWQQVLLASRDSAELLQEEQQLGLTFHRLLTSLDCELPANSKQMTYLPLFAASLLHYHIDIADGAISWLWSWLENQVTVACKALPLGQTQAQRLLRALMPELEDCAEGGLRLPDEQIGMTLPAMAMVSAWHETQYSRLFRS